MAGEPDNIQGAVSALQELASLETQTLTAEINIFGLLRERISPAARYGEKVQIRYQRIHYKTPREAEQWNYLTEGFPGSDRGKFLTALLVMDNYTSVDTQTTAEGVSQVGQYAGDRLYLTKDRKWILAERVGAYSEEVGSTSQWDAHCRPLSDHTLHERYSLEVVTQALFASINGLWEKLSPRVDTLKKRNDKVGEITGLLANLKMPQLGIESTARSDNDSNPQTMTRR